MTVLLDDVRVIVALDAATKNAALAMAQRLDPRSCRVKVGKELFTAAGPQVVDGLHDLGFEIFLDLKFHDIPNTVAGACRAAAQLGVWMVNVHASGGRRMLLAARDAIDSGSQRRPLLTAVTVLTSMAQDELADIGVEGLIEDQVSRLALLAEDCALDGVVCSAREAARLTSECRSGFLFVTPGIRPAGSDAGDQRRVVTPVDALRGGATHLVIGRPITGASDPQAALAAINAELVHACA